MKNLIGTWKTRNGSIATVTTIEGWLHYGDINGIPTYWTADGYSEYFKYDLMRRKPDNEASEKVIKEWNEYKGETQHEPEPRSTDVAQ